MNYLDVSGGVMVYVWVHYMAVIGLVYLEARYIARTI